MAGVEYFSSNIESAVIYRSHVVSPGVTASRMVFEGVYSAHCLPSSLDLVQVVSLLKNHQQQSQQLQALVISARAQRHCRDPYHALEACV